MANDNVPGELAAGSGAGFEEEQGSHVDLVEGAKTQEARDRRIAKAVDLFLAGKKR
jgi:hypothetical protein